MNIKVEWYPTGNAPLPVRLNGLFLSAMDFNPRQGKLGSQFCHIFEGFRDSSLRY